MKNFNLKFKSLLVAITLFGTFGLPLLTLAASPATIDLGPASNFIILAKTAITTTGVTSIAGDIGVSPAGAGVLTGFAQVLDISGKYSTSALVTGKIYAADYTSPTPSYVGTAVGAMEAAYTDAFSRATDVLNVGGGNLAGLNLVAGVYTFNGAGNVSITADVTLTGNATDVWIFQIPGTLDISTNIKILLGGAAQAKNVFWAVAGTTTLKPGSTFVGNILGGPGASTIAGQSGAILNGRALGQTDVTLIGNSVSGLSIVDPQLTVTKVVLNNSGGNKTITDFPLFIDGLAVTSGAVNTATIGLHTISETYDPTLYAQSFSADCPSGILTLISGDIMTCTITNDDIAVVIPLPVPPIYNVLYSGSGGSSGSYSQAAFMTTYATSTSITPTTTSVTVSTILLPPSSTVTSASTVYPSFPDTGFPPFKDQFIFSAMFFGLILFLLTFILLLATLTAKK